MASIIFNVTVIESACIMYLDMRSCAYMHACMYVCMYVAAFVCIRACMQAFLYIHLHACIHVACLCV